MHTKEKLFAIYTSKAEEAEKELIHLKKKIFRVSMVRIALFVAIIGSLVFLSFHGVALWIVLALLIVLFSFMVKFHKQLFDKKEYYRIKTEVNQHELNALNYNYSAFVPGNEYIDPAHLYSFDLDIFGKNSLFQAINRTSTQPGKDRLAEWMKNHLRDKKEIQKRQEAIQELIPETERREKFRITGKLNNTEKLSKEELEVWLEKPIYFRNNIFYKHLPLIVLFVNLFSLILLFTGIISTAIWGGIITGIVLFSFAFSRKISKTQADFDKKLKYLQSYAGLFGWIEEKKFKSDLLQKQYHVLHQYNQPASHTIKELAKLLSALDNRNNMLLILVLNGLFFWELKQVLRIEEWKIKHATKIIEWIEALATVDALCSLSTFGWNHPDYRFPEITDQQFMLSAEKMGHPLMDTDRCVTNPIQISKESFFIVITGANMAGKSTYLRTIGVNYLLACIGAPVFARKMVINPAQLITSLRTTDSLKENESYFFAELKRLKLIIDKLKSGEKLFIILDEILKGTNSFDKQKGSMALIKQFLNLNANGIIATHDLLLGSLQDNFPAAIRNYRFEAEIIDNELNFTYLLQEGVAQNMNACFLMNKMGITVAN